MINLNDKGKCSEILPETTQMKPIYAMLSKSSKIRMNKGMYKSMYLKFNNQALKLQINTIHTYQLGKI